MEILQLETWKTLFSEDESCFTKIQEYLDFIVQAVENYDPERYSEWHHILPRCLDVEKKYSDQGVRINGADHFRAHVILTECFSKKSRYYYLLIKPVVMMTNPLRLEGVSPEEVEDAKRRFSESQRGDLNPAKRPEVREKIREARLNLTPEQKKSISDNHADVSGSNNPFYGKHHSEESIQKMRRRLPDRSSENNPFYGKHHSEETKRKLRKPKSESHRKKISENRRGTVYITDGSINRFIKREDPLPEGFRYGRTVYKKK